MSIVRCDFLENISWNHSSPKSFTVDKQTDIWRTPVVIDKNTLDHLKSFLQPDELIRASRYHQEKDRQRFICSRATLRILIGKYVDRQPGEIQFAIGINKKPFVQNTGEINLHYNIAHAGNWILIAVSGSDVGVDVEKIDDQFSYTEILQLNFSPEEIRNVQASIQPLNRFYTCWTRKEAFTKATARGLDDKLPFIPCLDGLHEVETDIAADSWIISSFEVDERYVGSIAYRAEIDLTFRHIDLLMV